MQSRIQEEFSAISAAPEYTHRQHHTLKAGWQISHPFGCGNQPPEANFSGFQYNPTAYG